MSQRRSRVKTIDEYIAGFPEDVGEKLQALRAVIQKAAPDARETIRYGIPAFVLQGDLVHFGAFGDHIDFYPVPSGVDGFSAELANYRQGKSSARFPLDRPLPLKLVTGIVSARVAQNLDRALARYKFGR